MTIKHSKYKNTGILFELLVRQIASDVMAGKESSAVKIVKKYFTNTELAKEQKLYHSVLNSDKLDESKADLLLNTVLDLSLKLDEEKINKEKYSLIREIKKHYDVENFFKAKIDNYKISAAVFNLLESANNKEFTDTKTIIVNKLTILEHVTKELMTEAKVEKKAVEEFMKEDKDIRLLAYRILVEKFNTEYSTLSEEQKGILKEYINNVSDTKQLKLFLNNKIVQVKEEIEGLIPQIEDKVTVIKLTEVLNLIKPISERQSIKDENLVSLMQYYELVKEIKSSI